MEHLIRVGVQYDKEQAPENEIGDGENIKLDGFDRHHRGGRQTAGRSCCHHIGTKNGRNQDMDVDW